MRARIGAALVGVLVVAGCNVVLAPTDGGGPFDGEWRLVAGSHHGDAIPVPGDAPITMTIEGATVGGRAACNIYGGDLSIDGDRISVGAMSMTEMGCDGPIMDAEAAYLGALADVELWSRDGDTLTLAGEGVELRYERVPPVADAPLVGTSWQLDGLVEGDAVASTMGDPANLVLADDGTLSGSTGCRTFAGRYEADDGMVIVSDLVNDDRACPDLVAQDEHVLAVIGDGFAYVIDGRQLRLTDGRLGLVYVADEAAAG